MVDADESACRGRKYGTSVMLRMGIGHLGVSLFGFPPIEALLGLEVQSHLMMTLVPWILMATCPPPSYLGGSATVELVQGAHP